MNMLLINTNNFFDDFFDDEVLDTFVDTYEFDVVVSSKDIKKALESVDYYMVLCSSKDIDTILDFKKDNKSSFNIILCYEQDECKQISRYLNKDIKSIIGSPCSYSVFLFNFERVIKLSELEKIKTRLELDNKQKDHFIHTAFHDLKTPLFILQGFLDTVNESVPKDLDEFTLDCLHRAKGASERLEHMLNDLFKLSEVGKIQYNKEQVSMGELIHVALDELQMFIKNSDTKVEVQDDGKGWPKVYADKIQITKVLVNFIDNAIKYKSDESLNLNIGYRDEDVDNVIFFVQDNGIGIDKSKFKFIFDVFARVEEKESIKGTGLGLSIVKRIITDHGGEIWLESEKGKGSTFYFSLPKA